MKTRSHQLERLDTGDYTPDEYRDCLVKLGQVGERLGGDRAAMTAFDKFNPTSILDVGCGGGSFTEKLAAKFPSADVLGIDLESEAIALAKEKEGDNLHFQVQEKKELPYPDGAFDLVTATLVCHHMTDEELVLFLKEAARVARTAVILNDLHRSRLAWISYGAVAPLLFRNRLLTEDGLTSIRRSFKRVDWNNLLSRAGLNAWEVTWRWPFRWIVTIRA